MFRRELSRLLLTEIKDPRVAGITVSEVRVTNDLSYADVFVRVDSPARVAEAIEGLERSAGFVRRELGRALSLRKIPEFRFEVDQTLEHASRIEELLRRVREEDRPRDD